MIKAILVFNNHGKPRLSKFYQYFNEDMQQQIIKETFQLVSKRDDNVCNFLEGGSLIGGSDYKLIYRHYATLYFVFCVDSSESELGILDLIQVFVETLDKCFENVCELDLIFHADAAHQVLDELVMGGMVLQTNMADILCRLAEQNKMQKAVLTRPGRHIRGAGSRRVRGQEHEPAAAAQGHEAARPEILTDTAGVSRLLSHDRHQHLQLHIHIQREIPKHPARERHQQILRLRIVEHQVFGNLFRKLPTDGGYKFSELRKSQVGGLSGFERDGR